MPTGSFPKPNLDSLQINTLVQRFQINTQEFPVLILGVRGYYKELGLPGVNDRGIYDDALFIASGKGVMAFNGNTDPDAFRPGQGTAETTKGMASLKEGCTYAHRFGIHKANKPGGHPALVQVSPVTVLRDKIGGGVYEDTGNFGINIHRGGPNKPSSLGCQTIAPNQWDLFMKVAVESVKAYYGSSFKSYTFPYILTRMP